MAQTLGQGLAEASQKTKKHSFAHHRSLNNESQDDTCSRCLAGFQIQVLAFRHKIVKATLSFAHSCRQNFA